jgi:hypothetical protein
MGKCTGLPAGTAAEPQAPKPQPEQRVARKRDAARDIKENSPSKNLHKGELKHMRRDPKRAAHDMQRLANVLLSKEAAPGENRSTLPLC